MLEPCKFCGSKVRGMRFDYNSNEWVEVCAVCQRPIKEPKRMGVKMPEEKQTLEEDVCAAAVYAAMDVLKTQCGTYCEKRRIPIGSTIVEIECPIADLTLLREDQTLTLEQKRKFVKESQWAKDFVKKMVDDMATWGYPEPGPLKRGEMIERLLDKIAIGVVG